MASSNSTMPAPPSPATASTSTSTSTSSTAAVKAKPYVCLTCTRPFARLEHLKRHERSHTKEKPFTCEQAGDMQGCGRSFARRDLLLRHQQKIHLFPNTTKRRRLSTASTSLSADRRKSSAVSIPSAAQPVQAHRITMSMPNLEDLNNFSSGTVNPSSLFSLSPSDSSAHSGVEFAFPHTGYGQTSPPPAPSSTASSDVQWATEKLFPLDVFQSEDSNLAWSMPELLMDVRSPASSVSLSSAGYSPVQATHDVLPSAGGANALQMSPTGGAFPCAFPTDAYATALYLRNLTMESQRAQLALMQQQHEHQLMQQKEHQQRLSLSQQQQGSSPVRAPYSAEQLKMQVNLQHEQQRQHRQMDLAYAQANPGSYITDLGTSLQYNDEACFPTGYNFASLGGRNFVESF